MMAALRSGSCTSSRWILPSRMRTMRCAKAERWLSCVTITMVIPCLRLRSTRMRMTMSVFAVSRSPVGSSSSRISGQLAMARAMVTRCCSPPDSCAGRCQRRLLMPTESSSALHRSCRSDGESAPWRVRGSSTFSSAERFAIRLNV
mmetsp:Transcript_12562/g.30535  ORF Transcript_12562/g.30535 Transcript_12562/m.30535 type:complete len:146 (-) Transcript_12562:395-832(-)